ncbi:MAG: hypothetical protein OXH57_12870 [Ekhidna sp.]|nr:hypothetical protein [Ekhidna sp.]
MKHIVLILFVSIFSLTRINAQTFAGAGFSNTQLSNRVLDDAAGFSLLLEKDLNIFKSTRWKMHPNLHVSFLFSDYNSTFQPIYLNVISFSPKVSYEVFSGKKIKLAPYANPFVSFLLGLQSEYAVFESETLNDLGSGFEVGIKIDFMIGKTALRFIPLSVQRSLEDLYRQGMISLMVGM